MLFLVSFTPKLLHATRGPSLWIFYTISSIFRSNFDEFDAAMEEGCDAEIRSGRTAYVLC